MYKMTKLVVPTWVLWASRMLDTDLGTSEAHPFCAEMTTGAVLQLRAVMFTIWLIVVALLRHPSPLSSLLSVPL